jgi:hypothetical protein
VSTPPSLAPGMHIRSKVSTSSSAKMPWCNARAALAPASASPLRTT